MDPSRRSGARDNGLRCAGYVAIRDLDPRVADAMLDELRTVGIAAYVTPTPGSTGGYMETRLPADLTDRLFVDSDKADRAKEIVEAEHPAPPPASREPSGADVDIDTAWKQLLVSLQTPSASVTPTWPSSEDVPAIATTHSFEALELDPPTALAEEPLAEDEHFVPPPPPPLPKFQRVTIVSWLAILVGLLVIVTNLDDGSLTWLAILAILSGAAALIWHVKQGPPTDSGWDDGAVV
jgi:hypothetical protein